MKRTHRLRNVLILVTAWTLTVAWVATMWLLLRPYDLVTFPEGNTATVTPTEVEEGGTVTVTFAAYCNKGQVVTVDRYADIYRSDGSRAATEPLSSITFYPRLGQPECRAPEVQEVPLGSAFQAYGNRPTHYRIRSVTSYKPNPIRTVRVEAVTEQFTITP